jgi:hypothetical protein
VAEGIGCTHATFGVSVQQICKEIETFRSETPLQGCVELHLASLVESNHFFDLFAVEGHLFAETKSG